MKNPLNYQVTEYDCGPTTLQNAMSFLFKREEVPPDVIKHIMLFCLDSYNAKGEFGKNGTSKMAMMFLSDWLNQFGKMKKFPIHSEYLTGEEVFIGENSRIMYALQQGGAVVARVMYGCWHYVLLTGADSKQVYLFDPYYRKKPFRQPELKLINDMPYSRNRSVPWEMVNSTGKGCYALGPIDTREATIIFNRDTQKKAADTIEYFI
ncbi:peptidase C39 [Lacrimispora sp. JR3]|uniref:peptidase C39 n=1 Tax=Lacrimispora sinapis TaxID=3111456 RepID=UPI00374A5054